MILRSWRGWVSSGRVDDYVRYIEETGLPEYLGTQGNRGAQLLTRELGDGRSEVVTLSWWDSLESIKGFSGDDISVAKFYAEDDDYLIGREDTVSHYTVHAHSSNALNDPAT